MNNLGISATIAQRIGEARRHAGLTQEQLATAVGVSSKQVVAKWESGDRQPEFEMLGAIARATETTFAFLFGEIEVTGPPKKPTVDVEHEWLLAKQIVDYIDQLREVYDRATRSSGRSLPGANDPGLDPFIQAFTQGLSIYFDTPESGTKPEAFAQAARHVYLTTRESIAATLKEHVESDNGSEGGIDTRLLHLQGELKTLQQTLGSLQSQVSKIRAEYRREGSD